MKKILLIIFISFFSLLQANETKTMLSCSKYVKDSVYNYFVAKHFENEVGKEYRRILMERSFNVCNTPYPERIRFKVVLNKPLNKETRSFFGI